MPPLKTRRSYALSALAFADAEHAGRLMSSKAIGRVSATKGSLANCLASQSRYCVSPLTPLESGWGQASHAACPRPSFNRLNVPFGSTPLRLMSVDDLESTNFRFERCVTEARFAFVMRNLVSYNLTTLWVIVRKGSSHSTAGPFFGSPHGAWCGRCGAKEARLTVLPPV